jgi:hypothetical protein
MVDGVSCGHCLEKLFVIGVGLSYDARARSDSLGR